MNADVVTIIECYYDGYYHWDFTVYQEHVRRDGFQVTRPGVDGLTVEFSLDGRKVAVKVRPEWDRKYDVCVVGGLIDLPNFINRVKRDARRFKQQCPTTSIIVAGNAQFKKDPKKMGRAELAGWKIINRKMGDKLAREIGANKYVECAKKSGRGIKILFDETAYAYFAKLKDEEERRESETHENVQIERNKIEKERRKKFHRDFLFFFVLACSMIIISISVSVFIT